MPRINLTEVRFAAGPRFIAKLRRAQLVCSHDIGLEAILEKALDDLLTRRDPARRQERREARRREERAARRREAGRDIEKRVEGTVERGTESDLEDRGEGEVAYAAESDVDAGLEGDVAYATKSDVDAGAEGDVECATESDVDTGAEGDVECATESDVDTGAEGDVAYATKSDVDTGVEGDVAYATESDVDAGLEGDAASRQTLDAASRARIDAATQGVSPARPRPRSRHVPAAVRDAVALRDGGRCSYRGPDGVVCGAAGFVQFDHVVPFSRGGAHSVENGRLLCGVHNRLEGRRRLGMRSLRRAEGLPDSVTAPG